MGRFLLRSNLPHPHPFPLKGKGGSPDFFKIDSFIEQYSFIKHSNCFYGHLCPDGQKKLLKNIQLLILKT